MKGDFSRETFDPAKHYRAVLMQQGRVQVDADWNEQGAIGRYLLETEGIDVIGGCGAPIGDAGFEISTDGTDLLIGPGRFYVDGLLVENDLGRIAFDDQADADLPGASLAAALADMATAKRSLAVVYLDVWQRHVGALDDARLREVALGGPDTTTRVKTIWQVRLLPVALQGDNNVEIDRLTDRHREVESRLAALDTDLHSTDVDLTQRRERLGGLAAGQARTSLQRTVEQLQQSRDEAAGTRAVLLASLAEVRERLDQLRLAATVTCATAFDEWDALFAPHGQLNARAQPGDPSDDPCELPPGAGYTRLENQLYRVEVHEPGALGTATFKWSRDNGTVVTAIERISGSSVFVADLGPDEVLGFANDQWVELLDDTLELNGRPGQFARIVDVKPATNELVLSPAPAPLAAGPSGVDALRRPKLRRWDQAQQAAAPVDGNGIATSTSWLPLEDGVEVAFSPADGSAADGGQADGRADFATGDYWVIPARTATADLEWPPFAVPNVAPLPQERRGVVHHYCRLALLAVDGENLQVVADCRNLFPPLTGLTAATLKPALHVVATSWPNDGSVDVQAFLKDGLKIRLDGPPAPDSISNDSILVSMDIVYQQPDGTAVNTVRQRVLLVGTTGLDPADPQTILWRWDQPPTGLLPAPGGTAAATPVIRLNLTLRGHVIWQQQGNQLSYLDGQAFAQPVTDPATGLVRSDLVLPSGDGARASDFESWFFLGARSTQLGPLRVAKLEFFSLNAAPAPVLTIDTLPPDPAKANQMFVDTSVARVRATLSREAQPEGEFAIGVPQPAFLDLIPLRGLPRRLPAVAIVKSTLVEIRAQDPQVLPAGNYRLTILSQGTDATTGLRGAADQGALDGAFDGKGSNFVLAFSMLNRP